VLELNSEKAYISSKLKGVNAKYSEEIKDEFRGVVPEMEDYKKKALEYADDLSGVSEMLDTLLESKNPLKNKDFNTVARYAPSALHNL